MTRVLFVLTLAAGLALAAFLYRQLIVEGALGPAAMVGALGLGVLVAALAAITGLSRTRHRELVGKLLLAGTATLVSYLAMDLAAGSILIRPLSPPLVVDHYRHHALVPDSYSEIQQRDFDYVQRVNHFGLRGPEITLEKPAGTRRVLMLGDSFTMGKGVEDDQTFPVLVERALRETLAACGGGTVEVLNGGVDSYAPILSTLQFERDLARFAPDLVILNFDNSDLIQEAAYRTQAVRDEIGRIVAVPQVWQDSVYERFLSWTSRHLFLTRTALVYVNRAMDHRELTVRRVVNEAGREHFAHTLEGDIDRTAQWRDVFESVARLDQDVKAAGGRFVLSTYPWAHQVNDRDWVPGRFAFMKPDERTTDLSARTMREHSAALGIPLFEALPAFKAYTGSEPLYFKYDPHWTTTGQRVMADALTRFITERYVPDWCHVR